MASVQLRVFLVGIITLISLGVTHGAAVAKKDAAAVKPVAKATVAVLYFDYSGNDEEMGFLRKGLTQMLVTDLSASPSLQLVERTDLEAVLRELELNTSKKIDRSTANQIGKLLGARYLITGGYFSFRDKLRVDAKVIDVERGTTRSVGVLESEENFLALEAELASKLEAVLIKVHNAAPARKTSKRQASANRAARQKRVAKKKVAAQTVARYGKALDAIDRGKTKVAMKELNAITSEAPDFKPAAAELKVLLR